METGEKNTPIRSDAGALDASAESHTSTDDRSDTTASTPTVFKSLLKKLPQPPSSNNLALSQKNKKSVSFNQTVIVFCEEIEGSSPIGDQYEPPIGHKDSSLLDAFDPPKAYRDGKADGKKDLKSGCRNNIVGDASNLTDEKILGLIDGDTILDAFNLNCDDLSEEEFPINYLNSSNGFLCNDAVSDYDSNSESSLSTERKVVTPHQAQQPPKRPEQPKEDSSTRIEPKSRQIDGQSERTSQNNINHSSITTDARVNNKSSTDIYRDDKQTNSTPPNSSSSSNSRSLPARMKVTQLDANHLVKRNSARPSTEGQDLNRNHDDSKQQNESSSSREQSRGSPSARSPLSVAKKPIIQNLYQNTWGDSATTLPRDISNPSLTHDGISAPELKPQPRLPLILKNQSDRGDPRNIQSQPACHICREIESNKIQPSIFISNEHKPEAQAAKLQELGRQEKPVNMQPVVLNQSCMSCRDALMRQNIVRPTNAQAAQMTRPLTYRIVYVLDRNGNRVRALSLVNPQPSPADAGALRDQSHDNQIGLLGPVDIRALPGSQPDRQSQPSVVIPQYRLIRANQVAAPQSIDRIQPQATVITSHQQLAATRPAIYYMRKPLETEEMCQSPDYHNHGSRAFPDPHEIRRLDGLRAPNGQQATFVKTASAAQDIQCQSLDQFNSFNKIGYSQDESDDPTFGFSKRPAVKVVATSSVTSASTQTRPGTRRYDRNIAQGVNDSNLIIQDSTQTLDRRHILHQNRIMKENLPCTTSLSNLNSILVGNPNNLPRSTSGPRANATATRGMMIPPNIKRWLVSKLTPAKGPIPQSP